SQAITVASTSSVAVLTGRRHCRSRISSALAVAKPNSGAARRARSLCRPATAAGPRHGIAPGNPARSALPAARARATAPAPCPGETDEILGPLAAGRPHRQRALHHLRRTQAAPAALQLDLPVDDRRRPGLTKRFDQPGTPAWPVG